MDNEYQLTIVVDSNWQPWEREQMLCAYSWARMNSSRSDWEYIGQRPTNYGKKLTGRDAIRFQVVDISGGDNPVVKLAFQQWNEEADRFINVKSPFHDMPSSGMTVTVDLNDTQRSSGWLDVKDPTTRPNGRNFGGVNGGSVNGSFGKFGYTNPFYPQKEGDYELTVYVTTGGKTFKVDPEMKIGPPGG